MVNVTIDQLLDGTNIQDSTARTIFNQNAISFKGSTRPNPVKQINVINQVQLEAELGIDLIIPMNTSVIISVDDSFSLSKPFKKQAGSSLYIQSQSITNVLTYTGPGALIQMDGAVIGLDTQLSNITLTGNFTNECFAIEDSRLFITDTVLITNFAKSGFLSCNTVLWTKTGLITNFSGISFLDTPIVSIDTSGLNGEFIPPTTIMSFITTNRMDVVFENNQYVTNNTNEFLFFDPNSDINSSFKVRDSGIISTVPDSLFQKGVDVAVTAVIDNGSGAIRCTATSHGQVNNTYAVLSAFTQPYNGTFLITVIDNDTFDVQAVSFVAGDMGNINRSSLDATEPRVIAEDNPNQKDSFWLAEGRSQMPIAFTTITPLSIYPFQNDVPVNGDFVQDVATERFTVDSSTGVITYIGAEPITATVSFEFNISQNGGGTTPVVIFLRHNVSPIVKTEAGLTIDTSFQKVIYDGGLIDIIPGDTFQLFLEINSNETINIDSLKVLITRQ